MLWHSYNIFLCVVILKISSQMKSKSTLFLLTGIAIGAIAGALFAPQTSIKKKKKSPAKKVNKAKKSVKVASSKPKKEVSDVEDGTKKKGATV
jgi:gas vesicle protein